MNVDLVKACDKVQKTIEHLDLSQTLSVIAADENHPIYKITEFEAIVVSYGEKVNSTEFEAITISSGSEIFQGDDIFYVGDSEIHKNEESTRYNLNSAIAFAISKAVYVAIYRKASDNLKNQDTDNISLKYK